MVPPMTQEEVDEVLSFIESVNRASYSNNEIQSIIEEEAAPFYAGQKTAEEVAGIIQSRIQILVNESR